MDFVPFSVIGPRILFGNQSRARLGELLIVIDLIQGQAVLLRIRLNHVGFLDWPAVLLECLSELGPGHLKACVFDS